MRIGIIGDSWAANEKIDDYLVTFLQDKGIKSSIISIGHPGAKTRQVYLDLFKSGDEQFSSNHVLYGEPLDLCIVLVGVNDSATYVGSKFYAHHLKLIVGALTSRGIMPFIVEVPEYGIEKIDSKTIHGKMRRRIMKWMHHAGEVDVISEYRVAGREILKKNYQDDSYIYFNFGSISDDYEKTVSLYKKDLLHLSLTGNRKFALSIADTISLWYMNSVN